MSTRDHNNRESKMLEKIRDDSAWLVGERLGYDPTTTSEGRAAIELEMADAILRLAGAWMARQIGDEP